MTTEDTVMTAQDTVSMQEKRTRSIAHLIPYQFKKGNTAGRHGRPKAIVTKKEKLEILTLIARHVIQTPVSAGHKIAAIKESNLIEGVYTQAESGFSDNRQFTFIVSSEEAKALTKKIAARLLGPGEDKGSNDGEKGSVV